LQRGKLIWALLAHFVFAFVFGLLHLACWAALGLLYEFMRTGILGKFTEEFFRVSQFLLYVEVILYWAILGAGLARHAFRQAHERELKAQALEAQLQQAQLLALKQQLQPHFLFNSLNTVAMLVRNGESQQAVQMIAGLGELLRWSLSENAAQEVPLAAELESARRYLAIEQFRFPDRLRVEVSVPEELLSAAVPNLILQPLVENAVRHGIAKSSSASLVRISAERQASALALRVEDDGEGFPAEWQPGVGLRNTRARLARAYGAQAELNVTQPETHGASVHLRLPYRLLA
jgi:LytS/YehU family sensor histidine kinase